MPKTRQKEPAVGLTRSSPAGEVDFGGGSGGAHGGGGVQDAGDSGAAPDEPGEQGGRGAAAHQAERRQRHLPAAGAGPAAPAASRLQAAGVAETQPAAGTLGASAQAGLARVLCDNVEERDGEQPQQQPAEHGDVQRLQPRLHVLHAGLQPRAAARGDALHAHDGEAAHAAHAAHPMEDFRDKCLRVHSYLTSAQTLSQELKNLQLTQPQELKNLQRTQQMQRESLEQRIDECYQQAYNLSELLMC